MCSLQKISSLKDNFKKYSINAYLVPSFDEFQNKFVPESLQRLKWLTSFTGSNGIAFITQIQNYFFTDGRYITQAKKQLLNADFKIYNMQDSEDIYIDIFKNIKSKFFIGYDPSIFTSRYLVRFSRYFRHHKRYIELTPTSTNLVDELWERPREFKTKAAFVLNTKYTSQSEILKVEHVIEHLDTEYILLTSPESICWLLNIRGNDLPYSPLIMCYCLIDNMGEIEIFSDLTKLKCNYSNIKLFPFSAIRERILEINKQDRYIEYDPSNTPIWFIQNFQKKNILFRQDPCILQKARKDEIEISGFQYATIQDGVALTTLFSWLEENVTASNKITEIDVDQKLLELKKQRSLFKTKSFETVSAFAENSAIIHYNPHEGTNSTITPNNFYLLDCGSQYNCGTTDVSRTFYFGNPPKSAKLYYTLVLKGFINLCNLIFPVDTTGQQIDAIARQFLWQYGLDYQHGTGHGIGHYLSVHEDPQAINKKNNCGLKSKMVLSVEPGYYIPNKYGIRIENLVFTLETPENDNFLKFETLTLAPIPFNLVDENLLTITEKKWLIKYHERVYTTLSPFLDNATKVYLEKYLHYYTNLI